MNRKVWLPKMEDTMADLFNNGRVQIRKNDCDEIFIKDVKTGAEMRID